MDLQQQRLGLLERYVGIPTISKQIAPEAVAKVIEFWQAQGLELTRLSPPDGLGTPCLWGEIAGPAGAPTLLIYGHYDTQPPGDLGEWVWHGTRTDPFVATYFLDEVDVVDRTTIAPDRLGETMMVARGVVDNKGQHLAAIAAALEAARRRTLRWNVRILLDGEEESGSLNLPGIVASHRERLEADLCICADGPKLGNRPTLALGVRGTVHVHLSAENGQQTGVHSGNYGNIVPNPVFRLARLVEDLRTRVTDYARAHDPFRRETEESAELWDGEHWRKHLWPSVNAYHFATDGTSVDVRRLIIPRAAHANLDIRLTPDTPPDAIVALVEAVVAEHAEAAAADGVTIGLRFPSVKPGSFTSAKVPAFAWLLRLLKEQGEGAPAVVPLLGGTLPTWIICSMLGMPTMMIPSANCDNQQHDANEHFILQHFFLEIALFERIFTSLPGEA